MKKKTLLLGAILISTTLLTLASCANASVNTTTSNTTSVTPSSSNQPEASSSTYIPTSIEPSYRIEDNEITLMVFNEFKKSFPNTLLKSSTSSIVAPPLEKPVLVFIKSAPEFLTIIAIFSFSS